MTDLRSALAVKITDANPRAYETLVVEGGAPVLARELLDDVTLDQLLAVPIQDPVATHAMLAALWLWHDALDRCHEIVQKSPEDLTAAAPFVHQTPSNTGLYVLPVEDVENHGVRATQYLQQASSTLAFWHAIMHRREGDFSNSKYWYARCAGHPILPSLGAQASAYLNPMPADKSLLRLTASGWNPNAFVEFVEQLHARPDDPRHKIAVALQQLEWRVLFDHCTRAAAGK